MERKVTLLVGGKKVPLNPFSQGIIRTVILALVGNFKKVEISEEIEIKIETEA